MAPLNYFKTIRSNPALLKHSDEYQPLYQWRQDQLKASSSWNVKHLFASRVVITSASDKILRLRDPARPLAWLKIPDCQSGTELSKIINNLPSGDESLTETELVLKLGGTAGMFWAALHHFTQRSSTAGEHSEAADAPRSRSGRASKPVQRPDYIDSSTMRVGSSSPESDSEPSSFGSDDVGFVSLDEHTNHVSVEDATTELVSAFLRHTLIHCPLQQIDASTPKVLLEFSGIQWPMSSALGIRNLEFKATADGEVGVLHRGEAGAFRKTNEVIALVESKKCFKYIRDGRPIFTNDVLGQMLAEALTLRMSKAKLAPIAANETIIIIAATKQYLCFLSFHIPIAYVEKFQGDGLPGRDNRGEHAEEEQAEEERAEEEQAEEEQAEEEQAEEEQAEEEQAEEEQAEEEQAEDIITVRATGWLDLGTGRGRELACKNIAALVDWRQRT